MHLVVSASSQRARSGPAYLDELVADHLVLVVNVLVTLHLMDIHHKLVAVLGEGVGKVLAVAGDVFSWPN